MKAVLVLDEMPEKCINCQLAIDKYEPYAPGYCVYCTATEKQIGESWLDLDVNDFRPEWCPLKELQEREINYHIMDADIESIRFDYEGTPAYMTGHEDGWNECLDAIEGKES